jgi:thiosulfate dehydrogenase [quinone] large subunit
MEQFTVDRRVVLASRLLVGGWFCTQVFSDFSTAEFLEHTKTFHALYAPLTSPVPTFLVGYGHLLIGLSLVFGLRVRLSVALMLTYWAAHVDFPYIESHVNFLIGYHIVYAVLIGYLIAANAGHAFGLGGWVARWRQITPGLSAQAR